ncbi:tetratricopeptide repeat domain protein [Penicillium canariense]|uniref:Tetratricopeptide repeat domain protein n=1 Tax=Penicillium canariense TaxID=189055 RepID=A0A9W9I5H5_9EURO|nr:tetratricopeptide repeat domain protein [Penicillium canariense]KAJ5167143.1 tetratricopeptide repeat domain protein [Penicillium canariense]
MPLDAHLEECTIVWLCPLEIELRAAIAMLDRVSHDLLPRARGQQVVYTRGEIGHHRVAVVGYYQEQGLAASGSMAAEVIRDLPNLQFGLLVGVAGGIPSSTNGMQLGDVAVAVPEGNRPGIVGYDLGKEVEDGRYELKHWQNSTHPLLRSVINVIRARNGSQFRRHLRILDKRPEFQRPEAALPTDPMRPKVHYGTILSGNTVIKSQSRRDELRDMYGGIAVEMEAAGIMTRLPVAVIRGISDFADSSKNSAWQPYAAIAAAAYAKEVLLCLPYEDQKIGRLLPGTLISQSKKCPKVREGTRVVTSSSPFEDKGLRLAQALPEKWAFVGRKSEMAFLQKQLDFSIQLPIQKTIVCLWGLTGIGKSQLAAGFVNQQLTSHPEREIFWINGESQESFEQSVIGMLKNKQDSGLLNFHHNVLPGISVAERRALVNLFFAELNRLSDGRWLLVIDGVNESTSSNTSPLPSDIHNNIRAPDLISLLKGLPLALRLATSVISRYRFQINEYLEIWKSYSDASEILGTDQALYRSMELSLEELEKVDPIAANILALFSFLDHNDLWYEICHNATGDAFPRWLQNIARSMTPFRNYYPLLADLSFIELKVSPNGSRIWETHPAIQAIARQRAKTKEEEYIRCAISLVAAQVPRSSGTNSWGTMRRLAPHVQLCWAYIKAKKWGPNTNLTELESLARVFRQVGHYDEASVIYRMIARGLGLQDPTSDNLEFLADVLSNLGLVYTYQRKFEDALRAFDRSSKILSDLGTLTPDVSMSIAYNKAVVFMMTDRLDESEELLQSAAAHFSDNAADEHNLGQGHRRSLSLRILNDLGEVLLRQGDALEAFKIFQHVKHGQRNWQGGPHPAQLSLKLNMGRTLTRLGNFPEARDLLHEVVSIYTGWWGRRHPETIRAIDELAWTFMEEAKDKRTKGETNDPEIRSAEELWNEALIFYRRTDVEKSDTVARLEANLTHLHSCRDPAFNI